MPRVDLDLKALKDLENKIPGGANAALRKIARDMSRDVKTSFSPSSPSSAGGPPGVDTGALKNSIKARESRERRGGCRRRRIREMVRVWYK